MQFVLFGDQHLVDPVAVNVNYFEKEVVIFKGITHDRHLVDACENKTGHCGVIDLVEIDNKLLVDTCQGFYGSLTAHQRRVFVALKIERIGSRLITLLRDVSTRFSKMS